MTMRYLVIILLLLATGPVFSAVYGNVVVSEITSIYDADTFRVNIKDWPPIIGRHVSIRVKGIDAPEIRGQCAAEKTAAQRAKQHTADILGMAQHIELRNIERGKYFRILAEVYVDGRNLADILTNQHLARPYQGGKRQSWCQ